LEPIELSELAGITEDQAEDFIEFAEEAAERVEQETRASKVREPVAPPPIVTPAEKAAKLLGDTGAAPAIPAPTVTPSGRAAFDSLFASPAPQPLSTEQPVTEEAPAPAEQPAAEPAPGPETPQ